MRRQKSTDLSSYLLLTCLGLGSACATSEKSVDFTQVLLPYRSDIGKLAVVFDGEIDPKFQDKIFQSLKACPLYTDVRVIDKSLLLQSEATVEVFDKYLQTNAKGFGGLLKFRMEHLDEVETSEKAQSFSLFDQSTYDWYPSFGVPRLGTLGFADRLEIGPDVKKRRRSPLVKTNRYTQVYRMSFFHKPSNKIILDRVGKSISSLSTFSKDPGLSKSVFENSIRAAVLTDINFYACPPSEAVTRHIYSPSSSSDSPQGLREGFEAAGTGDWEGAAEKWKGVLQKDPKNSLANHNLGVYHERSGDIPKALPHYRKGYRDKRVREDAFGEIVGKFLPSEEAMEASIVHVTGGNWIFVDVPDGERRTRASVFRATPIIDPDTSRIAGQTLKEIAILRFVTSQESRRAARVREYLLDSPVRPGDMVVFSDNPSKIPKAADKSKGE